MHSIRARKRGCLGLFLTSFTASASAQAAPLDGQRGAQTSAPYPLSATPAGGAPCFALTLSGPCSSSAELAEHERALVARLSTLSQNETRLRALDDEHYSLLPAYALMSAGAGLLIGAALPPLWIGFSNGLPHSGEPEHASRRLVRTCAGLGASGLVLGISGLATLVHRQGRRQYGEQVRTIAARRRVVHDDLERVRRAIKLVDRVSTAASAQRGAASFELRVQF